MEASWANIFWLLLICIFIAIILIFSVCCYIRQTRGKQEISSLERNDSIRTQVSICSVWAEDEVGQHEPSDLETDTAEGEARPPDVEEQTAPPTTEAAGETLHMPVPATTESGAIDCRNPPEIKVVQ